MFALFLCMIPLATFFYMKRRQRNRYNQVAAPSNGAGDPTRQRSNRPVEDGGDGNAGTQNPDQAKWDKEKKELEDKAKAETAKAVAAEAQAKKAAEDLAQYQQALQQAQGEINERARYDADLAQNPNDPFLDDPTPREAYDKVKKLGGPAPVPDKRATRAYADGRYVDPLLKRKKSVDWLDKKDPTRKHPSVTSSVQSGYIADTDYRAKDVATYLKDPEKHKIPGHAGIAVHDGSVFTPRDQRDGYQQYWVSDITGMMGNVILT
jgi:hypothetical protein